MRPCLRGSFVEYVGRKMSAMRRTNRARVRFSRRLGIKGSGLGPLGGDSDDETAGNGSETLRGHDPPPAAGQAYGPSGNGIIAPTTLLISQLQVRCQPNQGAGSGAHHKGRAEHCLGESRALTPSRPPQQVGREQYCEDKISHAEHNQHLGRKIRHEEPEQADGKRPVLEHGPADQQRTIPMIIP